jgi:hypothetical protein
LLLLSRLAPGKTLSLMACVLVSSTISRILSPPLYATLANAQLQRMPVVTLASPSSVALRHAS